MYRSPPCRHCGSTAADSICGACGLWICANCQDRGVCQQTRAAWTGACKRCGALYPDEQRRDVLDDGDGQVLCSRCGSGFRLRRLSLVEGHVAERLLASQLTCERCSAVLDRLQLFVLEDRWVGPRRTQRIYHLLCSCGSTLSSFAD